MRFIRHLHINDPPNHPQDGSFQLVKEYSRPAAGQRSPGPREVRTPETLVRCVRYLVATVMRARLRTHDRQDLYDFLFDRLRAVRQDMVVQGAGVAPRTRLQLLATCARFHLVWGQLLAATPTFSAHLNTQHQLDTLKSCLVLGEGAGLGEDRELEAVQCVYLLSNLDSPHALNWAVQLPHRSRALGKITIHTLLLSNSFVCRPVSPDRPLVSRGQLRQVLPGRVLAAAAAAAGGDPALQAAAGARGRGLQARLQEPQRALPQPAPRQPGLGAAAPPGNLPNQVGRRS